jgi:uncharacterized membrane protein
LNFLPQARWECAAHHELFLQTGRQLIPLGEAGREVVVMVVIPVPHSIAVVIAVNRAAPVVVIVIAMFVAAVAVPMQGEARAASEREQYPSAGVQPSS